MSTLYSVREGQDALDNNKDGWVAAVRKKHNLSEAPPNEDALLNQSLAGTEYHGVAGASIDCQRAVLKLLQDGVIVRARIVTSQRYHCLLLTAGGDDLVAIKSGFSSGYGGVGPACFSAVLQL